METSFAAELAEHFSVEYTVHIAWAGCSTREPGAGTQHLQKAMLSIFLHAPLSDTQYTHNNSHK